MLFLIIFVIIPLIEIGLFIAVGDYAGIMPTLMLCVLTAVIGAGLIRYQGLHTLAAAREAMEGNRLPVAELFDGICLAVAGVLLMTPGFFTDTMGFLLLFPPVRVFLRHYLGKKFEIYADGANVQGDSSVIDGEYIRVDYEKIEHDKDDA